MTPRQQQSDLASFAPITMRPIGVVRSPFREKRSAPRQPAAARDVQGTIELFAAAGMEHAVSDLDGCDHLWVIFWFHQSVHFRPKVLPPRSAGKRRGVLATRSPHRPNAIGLSVVRLDRIEGLTLHIRDVDMLDGTPVLDVKPYVPYTDSVPHARVAWLSPLVPGEASDAENEGGEAADPEPGFEVSFEPRALEVLAFLAERGVDLVAPITSVLALGPQPHPYRRIRKTPEGFVLALKDWRARFVAEGRTVRVTAIETGYRAKQLAGLEPAKENEEALTLHRAVWERFAGASGDK